MTKIRKDKLQSKLDEMQRKREFFEQKEEDLKLKYTFQETDGMHDDEMWMDAYPIFHDY